MYDFSNYKPQEVPQEGLDQKEAGGEQKTSKKVWGPQKAPPENFQSQTIKHLNSLNNKLDKIYEVLVLIRWAAIGIGGMFAITFIIPQCTGG